MPLPLLPPLSPAFLASPWPKRVERALLIGGLSLAAWVWWLSISNPTALPFLAPWDFAPVMVLSTGMSLWWYWRGLMRVEKSSRPPRWRQLAFVGGLLVTYFVVQTRFDYMAQHMFFLNRTQHIIMHHLGPMLIVLGWPWATLLRGMPPFAARLLTRAPVHRFLKIMRQPILAAAIFVGLIVLWLIPAVHFRVMITPLFYSLMNWSMVLDGIIFWSVVLDPRPREQAGISVFGRAITAILIIPPQILIGAIIVFSRSDLYDFYHWCGRIYPTVDPLTDQTLGGLIVWIPSAMASIMAFILVLNFARQNENHTERTRSPAAALGNEGLNL